MKPWVEVLGSLAAFNTTVCWVPQALKILREKRTEGISLITQSSFTLGVALWAAYGMILHDWPIVAANVTTLFLSAAILMLKIRYSRRPSSQSSKIEGTPGSWVVEVNE